jgi:hypothetical protein
MARTFSQRPVLGPIDVDEDIRQSLTTITRERSRKLIVALSTIFAILFITAAFVYLAYSSEPGTMKPAPASGN